MFESNVTSNTKKHVFTMKVLFMMDQNSVPWVPDRREVPTSQTDMALANHYVAGLRALNLSARSTLSSLTLVSPIPGSGSSVLCSPRLC